MPISFKRFKSDQAAQVVVIFAFCLVPIFGVAGFCIDYQHKLQRMQKVQSVVDSAVLAAARVKQTGATDLDTKLAATNFITPQIDSLSGLNCDSPVITLTNDDEIQAKVTCAQDTTLSKVVGHNLMHFETVAASHYSVGKLDVAFVFDASHSMNGGNRMPALRAAAIEAIDTLLPNGAPFEIIENTRVAMASYSTMHNAGPFFEQVTNVEPTRTYYHSVDTEMTDNDEDDGDLFDEMFIGLYDADNGNLIAEIGNDAVIKVRHSQLDDIAIAITLNSSHSLYSDVESMRLELSGRETADKTENVPPYSLYGDSGIANLVGERWRSGDYTLRVRAYRENALAGHKVFDEEIKFKLFVDGDTITSEISHTITSTCVYERDGDEAFTDAPPGPGNYLAHQQAWFKTIPTHPDGGYWQVGFNKYGERRASGSGCSTKPPVELTNNRSRLINYVSTLSTDAYTAGHMGVAWSWYLISDRWGSVFDGSATPVSYTDPDIKKAVILMTDGAFNFYGHRDQGNAAAQARSLCDNMKLKHIDIYSVAFRAPASGQAVLRYCASNPGYYFEASNAADLKEAYKEIALSLSDLRISQ